MGADGPHTDWPAVAVEFIARNLPRDEKRGWEHMYSSAYQMGCEALAALGWAEEVAGGAIPVDRPSLPAVLPRWDDVCVAVVGLAYQQGWIEFRPPEHATGDQAQADSAFLGDVPDIGPMKLLGPADAPANMVATLRQMGLVEGDVWSAAAETVFWRVGPGAWGLHVADLPGFGSAVDAAIDTMPVDIHEEFNRLSVISDADVQAAIQGSRRWYEEMRAKFGPNASISQPFNAAQARHSLEFGRANDCDWLVFRRWRFGDGWLSGAEAGRALEVFHDPLAIAMRRAVAARLYPEARFLAGD